jgi:hypothetical protein
MNGAQSQGPAFLINIHRVDNLSDAGGLCAPAAGHGYCPRPGNRRAKDRQAQGVLPPKWVYPYVINDSRNIIKGAPFDRRAGQRLVRRPQG